MKKIKRLVSLLTSVVMLMSTLAIVPMNAEAAGLNTLIARFMEDHYWYDPEFLTPDSAKASNIEGGRDFAWNSNVAWEDNASQNGFPSSYGKVLRGIYNNPGVSSSFLNEGDVVMLGNRWNYLGGSPFGRSIEDYADTASLTMEIRMDNPAYLDCMYIYIKSYKGGVSGISALKADTMYTAEEIGTIKKLSIPISKFMSSDEDILKFNGGFDPSALCGCGMMLYQTPADKSMVRMVYDNAYICNVLSPTELHISDAAVDFVTLAWTASESEVSGYAIYRDGEKIDTVTGDEFSYTDSGLELMEEHNYTVRAVDIYGAESNDSNTVNFMAAPIGRPENLTAVSSFDDELKVQLNWEIPNYGYEDVVRFNVYRNDEKIAELNSDIFEYIDTDGVLENTEYAYYVKAETEDGIESMPSDVKKVTACYIEKPLNFLEETTAENRTISLTWEPVGNAVGYIVECNGERVADITDNTCSFVHENLEYQKLYIYSVRAYNANGILSLPTDEIYITIDNPEITEDATILFDDSVNPDFTADIISPNDNVKAKFQTVSNDAAKGSKSFDLTFTQGTSLRHGLSFVPSGGMDLSSMHNGMGIIQMYVKADEKSVIRDLRVGLQCTSNKIDNVTYNDVITSVPLYDYVKDFGGWTYVEVPVSEFPEYGEYRDGTALRKTKFKFDKVTGINIFLQDINTEIVNTVRFDDIKLNEYKSANITSVESEDGTQLSPTEVNAIDTSTNVFNFTFGFKLNPETINKDTVKLFSVNENSGKDYLPVLTSYDDAQRKITVAAASPFKKDTEYCVDFDGVFTANGAELKVDSVKLHTSSEDAVIDTYNGADCTINVDSVSAKSGDSKTVKLTVSGNAAKAYVTGGEIKLQFPKKLLSVSEKGIKLSPALEARGVGAEVTEGEIKINMDFLGRDSATMIGDIFAEIEFKASGSGADNMKLGGKLKVLSGSDEKSITVKNTTASVSVSADTSSNTNNSNGGGTTAGSRDEGTGVKATTPPAPVTNPVDDGKSLADASEVGWAEDAINYLTKNGYVNGYEDNTFRPNNNVTREEFASMLIRSLGIEEKDTDAEFSDVKKDDWYYSTVRTAAALGIVKGYDGKFGAGSTITRQDMCTMVYRAAQIANMTIPENYGEATFADDDKISDYAKESIKALQKGGIVNGLEGNVFEPNGIVTRAMAAKVLYGMLTVQPNASKPNNSNAETERSAATAKTAEAASRLKAFGVLTSADINSESGDVITGAEFAQWVMKLIGMDGVYGGDKAVDGAKELGYISDGDDFAADSPIKYSQAVKIVMQALGYGDLAQYQGGYPSGFLAVAGRGNVLKGISPEADGTLSRTNAVKMLDNALEEDITEITIKGGNQSEVKPNSGANILNTYLDVDKYSGKIDTIDRSGRNVTFTADGSTYTYMIADSMSIYSVIADKADIYVKDDEIVYISYKGEIEVMYDFIEKVNGDASTDKEYMTSGLKDIYLTNAGKKYSVDKNLSAYYEDKSIEWSSAPLCGTFAQVMIKGGKVIEIQAYPLYEGGVIYHASIDMIKYKKGYDSNNVINGFTNVDDLLIFIDGKPVDDITQLAPDMVFDYWLNDDEDKFIIVASSRIFTAELESYGANTINASGREYDVSGIYGCYAYNNTAQKYEACSSSIIKDYIGKKATFIVDDRKQLRYIRASATAMSENYFLGVIMKAIYDDAGGIRPSEVQFNIYNVSDGTGERIYELADSVKNSPVSLEYAISVARNLDGKGFFKFTLNSDGKISKIDVPQYWGDEFTYTSSTDNTTPSIIGKLYVKNSKLFAVYEDDGEFKVKELEWTADLKNVSFGGKVQVISDYDIYNNPIPDYVMFARGIENLNHKSSTQLLTDIEYIEDDKAIMTLTNLWGSQKYTVSKAQAEKYGNTPALVDCTTGHLAGDQMRITKYYDLSGDPDDWKCDPFEEFKTGFYRADKILYGDDQVVQFQIDGNPTNVYKLSDYFYVLQCERGKKTVLKRQKGNTALGYISPNDRVWFQTVSLDEYGIGVDFVICEKNGMAPKE